MRPKYITNIVEFFSEVGNSDEKENSDEKNSCKEYISFMGKQFQECIFEMYFLNEQFMLD